MSASSWKNHGMNSAAADDGNTAPSSSSANKYLVKEDLTPKQISHIQFGVLSPSEMQRLAEFQVCSRELFRMPLRTPAHGGCLDPWLGVSDKSSTCATCKLKLVNCAPSSFIIDAKFTGHHEARVCRGYKIGKHFCKKMGMLRLNLTIFGVWMPASMYPCMCFCDSNQWSR